MLKHYRIEGGRVVAGGNGRGGILVFVNPDEAERVMLTQKLRIDEHTLNSALDPNELSRIEFEPRHAAIITKRPKRYSAEDNFLFNVSSVGMFLFSGRLVIVLNEDIPLFEGKMFGRVKSLQELALKIIYRSIFHFEEHLRVINMCSEDLEHEINRAMENRTLLNLFTLEKSLVYYLNAIGSNGRVIDRLKSCAGKLRLTPESVDLLEDLSIENTQCLEQARIYSEVLAGLMDARVSVVSNNLNVLMKTLNIVMIGLMVPTFLVSLFSMNVPIPLSERPVTFWIVLAASGLLSLGVILLSKLKRW
ncbi:MAG: magnesium transporter CorA family protein [bacterium]|nr:magnesium transporter CorA family protein [bacterium]